MCQLCGCTEYIKQGKAAVLRRAMKIISDLSLTPENVNDYEETEMIAGLIAPFGSIEDDVYPTAVWVSSLHMDMGRLQRFEHYQAHVRAFKDIFSRLPARGEPKRIATTYHQLEQLSRELGDGDLASVDPGIGRVIQAVNRVHDGMEAKKVKLKQRYDL